MDPKPKVELQNLGAHSLKIGLLTMAARSTNVKFSMGERRTLGHHLQPGDPSVLTYSRDAYTTLYRKEDLSMQLLVGKSHDSGREDLLQIHLVTPDVPGSYRHQTLSAERRALVVESAVPFHIRGQSTSLLVQSPCMKTSWRKIGPRIA